MKASDLLREVVAKFELEHPESHTGKLPVTLIAKIRKALKMPPLPKENPIPKELADACKEFEVHNDLLELVKKGTLEYVYISDRRDQICFRIPELEDRKAGYFVYWQCPDKSKWEGDCRFYVNHEYDDGEDEYAWAPDDDGPKDENEPENLEYDIDALACWISQQAE